MIKNDKLEELAEELNNWRKAKKYRSQPFPKDLLARAKELSQDLGVGNVSVATGIQPTKLIGPERGKKSNRKRKEKAQKTQIFTKIQSPPSLERLVIDIGGGRQVTCRVKNVGAVLAELIRHV